MSHGAAKKHPRSDVVGQNPPPYFRWMSLSWTVSAVVTGVQLRTSMAASSPTALLPLNWNQNDCSVSPSVCSSGSTSLSSPLFDANLLNQTQRTMTLFLTLLHELTFNTVFFFFLKVKETTRITHLNIKEKCQGLCAL